MPKYQTDKIIKFQGKEYVLFEGLMEVAQGECGLTSISTNIIQFPTPEFPICIVQATATNKDGHSYTAHGDASPSNVGKMIIPHLIRMAETRAVARALRFMTGFGTAFDELGDISEQPHETNKKPVQSVTSPAPVQTHKTNKEVVREQLNVVQKASEMEQNGTVMSEDEIRALFGDDVEVVMQDDPVITENELKRIRGKIGSCKPKEAKHYGVIYSWIAEVAGIQIKSKDDLPKITQDRFNAVAAVLDSKANYFEQVAV